MEPTKLRTDKIEPFIATRVAEVQAAGGSPRAQIDAGRAVSGRAIQYIPHQSTREIERRQRQEAKRAARNA